VKRVKPKEILGRYHGLGALAIKEPKVFDLAVSL